MKTPTKLLLGAATVWPIVYLLLFLILSPLPGTKPAAETGPQGILAIEPLLTALTEVLVCGLILIYIARVIKNDTMSSDSKVVWIIGLVLAGALAMPIYWYNHILHAPVEDDRG